MESNVIRNCHDDMAHVGVDKVLENLRRIYWFPNMTTKVRNYIQNCLKCIEYSPKTGKRDGYLYSIPNTVSNFTRRSFGTPGENQRE